MRALILLAGLALLAGCGASKSEADAGKAAQAAATPAQKTVLDAQLNAIQKAKDVQKTVDDQAARTDQAIENAEGDNGGG